MNDPLFWHRLQFGFLIALVWLGILFRIHRGTARAAAEGEGY